MEEGPEEQSIPLQYTAVGLICDCYVDLVHANDASGLDSLLRPCEEDPKLALAVASRLVADDNWRVRLSAVTEVGLVNNICGSEVAEPLWDSLTKDSNPAVSGQAKDWRAHHGGSGL